MSDVNKDELYKILDLVNLLNNRVVNLLERVNKNSSNNKYKLPVINKTEIIIKKKVSDFSIDKISYDDQNVFKTYPLGQN